MTMYQLLSLIISQDKSKQTARLVTAMAVRVMDDTGQGEEGLRFKV